MQLEMRVWHERWRTLSLLAAGYAIATLFAQMIGSTPAWQESSPVEVSTDFVASLGLAFAAFQARRGWAHAMVRRSWLLSSAAMFLIWCGETAVDKIDGIPFQFIILAWAIAALLLFRGMRSYAIKPHIPSIMWFGLTAQAIAHLAWVIKAVFLAEPHDADASLEIVTDTGELIALLSYIVGFVMARASGLDAMITEGSARLKQWACTTQSALSNEPSRLRICFPFIAQLHQVFHSLPIAVALAQRHPEIDVHIATTPQKLPQIQELVLRKAGITALIFDPLHLAWPWRLVERLGLGLKRLFLSANRHYLSGFDAVVVPERTSTYLRKISPQIRLIGTEHGAGDREVTFVREIALYDFLLLPGQKQARRLLELGYAKPGRYVSGVYAKLDWTQFSRPAESKLFENDRPTVLYNPHFEGTLSSWPVMGHEILERFAQSAKYNLIFAPHIRLFDRPTPAKYHAFREYSRLPHVRIDLGSERSVDMTYAVAADIYLGDVSSQVVEFVTRPRPCIFLNPRRVNWERDPHYRFWHLGAVVETTGELEQALSCASPLSPELERRQREYIQETLGTVAPGEAGPRGAEAILAFLMAEALRAEGR